MSDLLMPALDQFREQPRFREQFRLPAAHWVTYVATYLLVGTVMNQVGQWMEIAKFVHWWQVITVYVFYMVPISVFLRKQPWWQQYLYGLFPMGLLEFGGYALHSSYAYPHNILDRFFDERNFSLCMVLFFAAYFPLLNGLVARLYRVFTPQADSATPSRASQAHAPLNAAIAQHYDELDFYYRDLWGEHIHHGLWRSGRETPAEAAEQMSRYALAELDLTAGERIADIGCGYGSTARLAAESYGVHVVGLTLSETQKRHADKISVSRGSVEIRVEDWVAATFADGAFDALLSLESLEHIDDKA